METSSACLGGLIQKYVVSVYIEGRRTKHNTMQHSLQTVVI